MAERPSDLLPCPWCGEPLDSVSVSEGSTFRWRKVDGCCADGPEVRHDTVARDRAAAEADSKRRAIEAWNTRARTLDAAPSDYAMARALEWLRTQVKPSSAEERECMGAIEEAVAAYVPPEVRTVSRSQAKRLAVQRASEPSAECWRRAVEQWKAKHGWYVGDRLQAVCEVEALAREIAREGK